MPCHNSLYITCPRCGNETKYHALHFENAPCGVGSSVVRLWFMTGRHHHVASHVCDHCHHLIDLPKLRWPAIYYIWLVLLTALGSAASILTLLYLLGT